MRPPYVRCRPVPGRLAGQEGTRPMVARGWQSARSSLSELADLAGSEYFTTTVSLHAHTHYSRESLTDVPRHVALIPLVGKGLERDFHSWVDQDGCALDFSNGWWHPPVAPRAVFESEAAQIERRLGLRPLVSVTDHDDIRAGLDLQRLYANRRAPISF